MPWKKILMLYFGNNFRMWCNADCNLLTNHKLIPYSSKYIMHCLRYRDMSNKKVDESFQKVCRLVMNTVVVLSSFLTSLSLRPWNLQKCIGRFEGYTKHYLSYQVLYKQKINVNELRSKNIKGGKSGTLSCLDTLISFKSYCIFPYFLTKLIQH